MRGWNIIQAGRRVEVDRRDLSRVRLFDADYEPLRDGEIRVRIEAFALTANNISYGVVGEKIGYWDFFPAPDEWGVIPVWGVALVSDSRHSDIEEAEALYGYFPMGASLTMKPEKVTPARLFDATAHRAGLPPVYNAYKRLDSDPDYDPSTDEARIGLYPLFATSFCLYDFFADNDWFGAEQIVVLSASSKTAIGCAIAFGEHDDAPATIGLTSNRNRDWVDGLGLYDTVASYDDIGSIDARKPTAIIDMSGNGSVLGALHKHLGDNMRYTANVGLTHWSENATGPDFIRERSAMFFAPGHIQKRASEWGPGVFEEKSNDFWVRASKRSDAFLTYDRIEGLARCEAAYHSLLKGDIPPDRVLIIRP